VHIGLIAEEGIGSLGAGMGQIKSSSNASPGLEVAVSNLQDYCNELENRLLSRFDVASQKRELSTMAECAKILSQVVDIMFLSCFLILSDAFKLFVKLSL
jgi:hypothetical protein